MNWVEAFRDRKKLRDSMTVPLNNLRPPPCSQKELKALLRYDDKTGAFTWVGHRYKAHNGKIAGGRHKTGTHVYWEIKIFSKKYKAHNLAYYYMTGVWTQIDHRNNKTLDNRFKNLRPATNLENARNKLITKNSLGYKGIAKVKNSNKFQATICINYKSIYLGVFDTPEEAHTAYCEAAVKYHKEFAKTRNGKAKRR